MYVINPSKKEAKEHIFYNFPEDFPCIVALLECIHPFIHSHGHDITEYTRKAIGRLDP